MFTIFDINSEKLYLTNKISHDLLAALYHIIVTKTGRPHSWK